MKDKIKTARELTSFFRKRGLWWILPMIIVFLVFGIIIVVLGSSPLAPIVYPLF